ncbi:MAG: ARMT1-like domain-containing protein [Thermodesulfobacteriota bacterium]
MHAHLDCLPCFVRQALDAARLATTDESLHEEIVREVMRTAAACDLSVPSPVTMGGVYRMVRERSANPDPYREVKERFNRGALQMKPALRKIIDDSYSPIETAVRLAVAGNIIDPVVNAHVDLSYVAEAVTHALDAPLPSGAVDEFLSAVQRAGTILYLGDNAGEIVFDTLLVELLPKEKITFVVKGSPVINDVTMLDAESTGMTGLVPVIDNGSDIPGTALEFCSPAFRDRFARTDLIISKGQGNFESLSDVDGNIFFLFKAKCLVMTKFLHCPEGTVFVSHTTALTPHR